MRSWLLIAAGAFAFVAAFRTLPAPASGWRGGLGRFLQAAMAALLMQSIVSAAWEVFNG
jgi:hypothetical protein